MKTTALIENLDGNFVGPEELTVEEAQNNAEFVGDNTFGNFLDVSGKNSYPFVMMNYVVIRKQIKGITN